MIGRPATERPMTRRIGRTRPGLAGAELDATRIALAGSLPAGAPAQPGASSAATDAAISAVDRIPHHATPPLLETPRIAAFVDLRRGAARAGRSGADVPSQLSHARAIELRERPAAVAREVRRRRNALSSKLDTTGRTARAAASNMQRTMRALPSA
jgi:hypothetical protein